MNPDLMADLERFEARRYVALCEAEAAELGSGVLAEWREASRDGVHVDAADYLELLRDGARWRRLCSALSWTAVACGAVAAGLALIFVLGLIAQASQ